MELKNAIEILDQHNKWRRDNDGIHEMPDPKEIGQAIDLVVNAFKNQQSTNVCKSFTTKEELATHIAWHMPIAIKPIKPTKTTFVNPFTSHNAQKTVEKEIVECLLSKH